MKIWKYQMLHLQDMYTALNSQVWGIDLCHKSSNSSKFAKEIDAIKFICNHLCYLPALQNLNVMEAEDQNVQHKEYAFQYYDVKK